MTTRTPMRAFKFLKDDYRSGSGRLKPWAEGMERTHRGQIVICHSGFHSSPSWYDALKYAQGNVAALVEISEPEDTQGDKYVSRTMKVLAMVNVEHILRLYACDCAERALNRERERGREPDPRSWKAVEVARAFAGGKATREEWAAARYAAWNAADAAYAARDAARDAADAARDAAGNAAWNAAWNAADAAGNAAWNAAWNAADAAGDAAGYAAWNAADAARDAETGWQKQRLQALIDAAISERLAALQ